MGIGATEFSKDSGRSELRLATEAILGALDDAGLTPADVDGIVSVTMDNNDVSSVARAVGIDRLTCFWQVPWGGGAACGTVQAASAAILTGAADVVVCFRAMNERSQQRFGRPKGGGVGRGALVTSLQADQSWATPFACATAATGMALSARRYMQDYGATSEDFGRVSVCARDFASTNPNAWFYEKPISLADHQNSRVIADPLRLLDCCQESDGAVALVITSSERAHDLKQKPAFVAAAAQGMGPQVVNMASPYGELSKTPEVSLVGNQMWRRSGLRPDDMDVAIIYDHFSFAVLMQLEALGFCGMGEAPAFVAEGNIGRGGPLPVNTHGGQVGEAYMHGFNGITEAVRQIRGTAVNQVPDAARVVITSGSHVPTSGLILSAESP
jgi:acetyl-CoA acetyltransferase